MQKLAISYSSKLRTLEGLGTYPHTHTLLSSRKLSSWSAKINSKPYTQTLIIRGSTSAQNKWISVTDATRKPPTQRVCTITHTMGSLSPPLSSHHTGIYM